MANTIQTPTPFSPFAGLGWNVYLSDTGAPPTSSQDGAYNRGDWIICATPVAGSVAAWVCTSGGQPATWRAIALA